MLTIGLLSGTSIDGIDAALVDCSATTPRLAASLSYPISAGCRQRVVAVASTSQAPLSAVAALNGELGELFAEAALALMAQEQLNSEDIAAIGSHGQTVYHQPLANPPATLQLGSPAIIAARTGIQTIADFRVNDMAYGGQGAPLAPLLHQQLFGSEDIAIVNLGGIANLTLLHSSGRVQGYDTGPANTLLDHWVQQHKGKSFDENGGWARSGRVNSELLDNLLSDDYFSLSAPKSTGTDYFSSDWLSARLDKFIDYSSPADIQATLAELTAVSVTDSLHQVMPNCKRLLVCGGGALNGHLLARMNDLLSIQAESTAALGHDPQWVEGMLFGWLAYRRLNGLPGNLPSATGASRACQLGAIYPAS